MYLGPPINIVLRCIQLNFDYLSQLYKWLLCNSLFNISYSNVHMMLILLKRYTLALWFPQSLKINICSFKFFYIMLAQSIYNFCSLRWSDHWINEIAACTKNNPWQKLDFSEMTCMTISPLHGLFVNSLIPPLITDIIILSLYDNF